MSRKRVEYIGEEEGEEESTELVPPMKEPRGLDLGYMEEGTGAGAVDEREKERKELKGKLSGVTGVDPKTLKQIEEMGDPSRPQPPLIHPSVEKKGSKIWMVLVVIGIILAVIFTLGVAAIVYAVWKIIENHKETIKISIHGIDAYFSYKTKYEKGCVDILISDIQKTEMNIPVKTIVVDSKIKEDHSRDGMILLRPQLNGHELLIPFIRESVKATIKITDEYFQSDARKEFIQVESADQVVDYVTCINIVALLHAENPDLSLYLNDGEKKHYETIKSDLDAKVADAKRLGYMVMLIESI